MNPEYMSKVLDMTYKSMNKPLLRDAKKVLEEARKQEIESAKKEYCEECSDRIMPGEGRYRLPSGTYHDDCYEEKVIQDQEVIKKAAESMSLDQRITA